MLQEVVKSVNASANGGVFNGEGACESRNFATRCEVFLPEHMGIKRIRADKYFRAILPGSLHFIGAASKLALLYLCKGNALRC